MTHFRPVLPAIALMGSVASAAPDVALYERGLDACRTGRFAEARQLLARYLEGGPPADLADNALYWYGEAFYADGRYEEAARQFEAVRRRFPKENKAPDAMLKLGFCREKLGDVAGAMEALRDAWRLGGESDVGRKAQERLETLRAAAESGTPLPPATAVEAAPSDPPATEGRPAPATTAGAPPAAPALPTPVEPAPRAPSPVPTTAPSPEPPRGAPVPSPGPSPVPPAPAPRVEASLERPELPLYWPGDVPSPDRWFVASATPIYPGSVWGFAVSPEGDEAFVYENARVNVETHERQVKEGLLVPLSGGEPRPGRPPEWFAAAVKADVFEGPKQPSERSYGPDGVTYAYSKYYARIRNVVLGRQGVEHVLGAGNLPFWLPDGRLLVVGFGRDGNDSLTEGLTLVELGVR
jgi:tol-pal system protein YbgF